MGLLASWKTRLFGVGDADHPTAGSGPVPTGDGRTVEILERWDAVRVGGTWHRVYELIPPDEVDIAYARLLLLQEKLVTRGRTAWVAAELAPGEFRFGWAARKRLRRIEMTTQAEALSPGMLQDDRETGAAAALRGIYDARRRNEPLVRWRMLAGVTARTETDVKAAGRELEIAAENSGFLCRLLWARQWPALRRIWLGGPTVSGMGAGRLAPLSTGAGLVPVIGGGAGDGRGIYVGHRLADGRRVLVDMLSGTGDSNVVVVGRTGSGKSTWLKALYQSLRQVGCRLVHVDLDGEGRAQCAAMDGTWMDLTAATGRYIDPLILPPPAPVPDWLPPEEGAAVRQWNQSRLALALDTVKGFVSLLAGDHWTPETSSAAHRAIMDSLGKRGVDPADDATWGRGATMGDWWAALKDLSGRGTAEDEIRFAARRLVNILEPHFDGALALFRDPVSLAESDAIWLHFAAAMSQGADRLAAAAKITLALTTLWAVTVYERVRGERFTVLGFDEAQRLLENEDVSRTVLELVTAVRKYNALTVLATNMPQVFWHSRGGRAAWQNSSYRVLFGLEKDALREIAEAAPGGDDGIPPSVLARLAQFGHKGTPEEHAFLFRHPVRGWDECILKLPAAEMALYRTKGLRTAAGDPASG